MMESKSEVLLSEMIIVLINLLQENDIIKDEYWSPYHLRKLQEFTNMIDQHYQRNDKRND